MESSCRCKICGKDADFFESAEILHQYKIRYYKCRKCGYLFTEKPYWLKEAYSSAIADSDIGLLKRNLSFAKYISSLLKVIDPYAESFLDCGGGYGIFVRLMRDEGYDFEWEDKYCRNIFAKGHERKKEHYDYVTAFELAEHIENPVEEFGRLLETGTNLIFSTELVSHHPPDISDWWYYSLETGQHISFYTKESLEIIARRFGRSYSLLGSGLHLFSRNKVPGLLIKCSRTRAVKYFEHKNRRNSLLAQDYRKVSGNVLK